MVDWGDGSYEYTAKALLAATEETLRVAGITPGTRVLDLGCGTGNAALGAARLGAEVTAIDPAERLVSVARARADAEQLRVSCLRGSAEAIPAADAAFDVVLSVFAVIFSPDAEQAAAEMIRVTRPGGRIVVTSWVPTGGIAEAGGILRAAMTPSPPPAPARPAPAWGDPAFARALFGSRGAQVEVEEAEIPFSATSPEAWFDDQETHHPVWRFVHRALVGQPGAWNDLRARSLERLRAWNEAPGAFRVTSRYLVITAST
jgi:SAM-dependent methyltransferase